jgi:hypothetical protein
MLTSIKEYWKTSSFPKPSFNQGSQMCRGQGLANQHYPSLNPRRESRTAPERGEYLASLVLPRVTRQCNFRGPTAIPACCHPKVDIVIAGFKSKFLLSTPAFFQCLAELMTFCCRC